METAQTRRIRMTVHYDGGGFHGWQFQSRERSVQGEIEAVLSRLFSRPTRILGSGRTDRGVHATGQVATVDAPARWTPIELRRAMNALLPPDIWIRDSDEVPDGFHPRYDAVSREYVYRIGTREITRSPFHAPYCWPFARPLDEIAMADASATVIGDHSFQSFAKSGQESRGHRCIVTDVRWSEWPGLGVEFRIAANRFLHHMVRYLVGTFVEIGYGRRPASDVRRLLAGDPALETSPPAPPQGLFLETVLYPDSASQR